VWGVRGGAGTNAGDLSDSSLAHSDLAAPVGPEAAARPRGYTRTHARTHARTHTHTHTHTWPREHMRQEILLCDFWAHGKGRRSFCAISSTYWKDTTPFIVLITEYTKRSANFANFWVIMVSPAGQKPQSLRRAANRPGHAPAHNACPLPLSVTSVTLCVKRPTAPSPLRKHSAPRSRVRHPCE